MFKLQIEPWDQVQNIEISTIYATIRLREEGDFVNYEHSEHGRWEHVEYKFRIRKRENYKQYVKELVEVDVEPVDLKNLIGTLAYFREIYQQVVSTYRRGVMANARLRWWDEEILVEFDLQAARGEEYNEVQSMIKASCNNEYLVFLHWEKSEDVEEDLKSHTVDAAGLYMLFKEYIQASNLQNSAPKEEPDKT
jgi:hypothetical protein